MNRDIKQRIELYLSRFRRGIVEFPERFVLPLFGEILFLSDKAKFPEGIGSYELNAKDLITSLRRIYKIGGTPIALVDWSDRKCRRAYDIPDHVLDEALQRNR